MLGLLLDWKSFDETGVFARFAFDVLADGLFGMSDEITATAGIGKVLWVLGDNVAV